MTREIKFRAWDKGKGKYLCVGFHIIGEITVFDALAGKSLDSLNNIIVEQYTGLKDKNGKEIYEGDIVQITNEYEMKGDPFVIEFKEQDSSRTVGHGYTSWNISYGYHFDGQLKSSCNEVVGTEVIGNMHQNPELL